MASASDTPNAHVQIVVGLDYEEEPQGGRSTAAPTLPYKKKPATASSAAKAGRIRKSPNAPKRFKSSYILFFMSKQADIKKELGDGGNVGLVSKKSAELWKNLSPAERSVWDEKAAEDKARYNTEKKTYNGPWQIPWKRRKKDPTAPKRPMSAFLFFTQKKRSEVQAANPAMKNKEVSRMLGDMWRNMTPEEKAPHLAVELQAREQYKTALAKWKEQGVQEQPGAKLEEPRVDDASLSLFANESFAIDSSNMRGLMHNYLIHQTFGLYAPLPQPRSGPHPDLPTTGRPVVLGPAGVPLLPSQQPLFSPYQQPMTFDEEFDFDGEDVDHDTGE